MARAQLLRDALQNLLSLPQLGVGICLGLMYRRLMGLRLGGSRSGIGAGGRLGLLRLESQLFQRLVDLFGCLRPMPVVIVIGLGQELVGRSQGLDGLGLGGATPAAFWVCATAVEVVARPTRKTINDPVPSSKLRRMTCLPLGMKRKRSEKPFPLFNACAGRWFRSRIGSNRICSPGYAIL